jgi:hypothetical protein
MNTKESIETDIIKIFNEKKQSLEDRKEIRKIHKLYDSHITINIPKPRTIIRNIKDWIVIRRHSIPKCCGIIRIEGYDPYRYCELAVFDSDKYSQRHSLRCPITCSKCDEFHHDYYYDKKEKLTDS